MTCQRSFCRSSRGSIRCTVTFPAGCERSTGTLLKEIDLGPVFAGPSLSRGRVYVGGGNTLWNPSEFECFFPKQYTGSIRCSGLPGKDEIDELGSGDE